MGVRFAWRRDDCPTCEGSFDPLPTLHRRRLGLIKCTAWQRLIDEGSDTLTCRSPSRLLPATWWLSLTATDDDQSLSSVSASVQSLILLLQLLLQLMMVLALKSCRRSIFIRPAAVTSLKHPTRETSIVRKGKKCVSGRHYQRPQHTVLIKSR